MVKIAGVSLHEALGALVPDLCRYFDVRRASVRLLSHDQSEVFIVAVWSDAPTLLKEGISYRSSVGSLLHAASMDSWPLAEALEPGHDLVDSILYEEGLRSFAMVRIPAFRGASAFLSISSPDPDAFEGKDLSDLERAAEALSAALVTAPSPG